MEKSDLQNSHQKVSKLESLPASDDRDFWSEADIHTNIVPKVLFEDEPHYLVRISGHQAHCTHCNWGFELDPGDNIVDGHLYNDSGILVI